MSNASILQQALDLIKYDTSIEAGDDRVLMQAAEVDLRNGVLNQNTTRGLERARKWLDRAAMR